MGKRNEPSKTQLAVLEAMQEANPIVYVPKLNRYKLEGYGTVPYLTVVGLANRGWIVCKRDKEGSRVCHLGTHGGIILEKWGTQPRTQSPE